MLITLFGDRWAILAPFALYLSTALTLPALMWWTACLNQLAMQLGFFVAVGAWVRYCGDRLRWALVAYAVWPAVCCSTSRRFWLLPVLVYLALAWFAEGSPWRRVRGLLRRYWLAALSHAASDGLRRLLPHQVDQPFERATPDLAVELTGSMSGRPFHGGVRRAVAVATWLRRTRSPTHLPGRSPLLGGFRAVVPTACSGAGAPFARGCCCWVTCWC